MQSLKGHFLVASRYLRDSNFAQSVVLMLQHDLEGALGVVLNRPGNKTVREVWELTGQEPCPLDDPIHVGGPVPGPLMAVHTIEELSEREITPELFFSVERDALNRIVRHPQGRCRLFSGHAGWGSGQLEGELKAGGWLTTAATVDDVFADYEELWRTVVQRIGLNIMAPGIDPERMPEDPSLN